MNILNLNQLLKKNGFKRLFPLDFIEKLNNNNLNNADKAEIINVLKTVNKGQNPLMYILYCNKYEELRFKSKDILNLINLYPEQLLHVNKYGWNPLMYILLNNRTQELGLNNNDIINIINLYPEQLLQIDQFDYNPLIYILAYNKKEELGFDFNKINEIYEQQTDKEYINKKINEIGYGLTYFHEFLDYRKTLLEKQKINNFLETKQNNKEKSNYKL